MTATSTRALQPALIPNIASLRMDLLANPYTPVPEIGERSGVASESSLPADRLESILIARIARYHRISPESVVAANGVATLLPALFRHVGSGGPLLVFPPSDEFPAQLASEAGCELREVPRTAELKVRATAMPNLHARCGAVYCMSPNDPCGTQLRLQDAVSIARAAALLIIDERHSAYAARDHLPLQREFNNVILVRTLETWGGLTTQPLAYAIADPAVARAIREHDLSGTLDAWSLHAGIVSFEHSRYLEAAARKITHERVDLIRSLRKLNMVRPMPSAANFVLATLERGDRDLLRTHLDGAGIALHYPEQPGLENTIRISTVSPAATRILCEALISWARYL